jgi:upstream activation factor subunit UAF30
VEEAVRAVRAATARSFFFSVQTHPSHPFHLTPSLFRPSTTQPKTQKQIQAFLAARNPAGADAGAGGEAEAEAAAAEEEDEEEPAPRPTKKAKKGGKKKAPGGMEPRLSPELAAFVGAPRMHRFKIVKAIWAYIKAHGLQDPADKRAILPDEKLGTILSAPVNMFSMNKQLNRHILPEEGE